jgi:hypothetical protein
MDPSVSRLSRALCNQAFMNVNASRIGFEPYLR